MYLGVLPNVVRGVRNGLCERNFSLGKGADFDKRNPRQNLMCSERNRNLD